jgi:large subunit ribosomal protein L46
VNFSHKSTQLILTLSKVSLHSFRRSLGTDSILEPSFASSEAPLPVKRSRRPQLTAAVVLNRSPILTRTPTLFERAYYAYQARIRRALHNPFPLDFYFKQGSLLETHFNMEEKKRERRAFGPTFSMDEFISKEKAAAEKAAADQLALQEGDNEQLMQRVHVSDTNREFKSLDRKGKRNLYLLLRTTENGQDSWRFPEGGVEKGELLHQASDMLYFSLALVLKMCHTCRRLPREICMSNAAQIWIPGLLVEILLVFTSHLYQPSRLTNSM